VSKGPGTAPTRCWRTAGSSSPCQGLGWGVGWCWVLQEQRHRVRCPLLAMPFPYSVVQVHPPSSVAATEPPSHMQPHTLTPPPHVYRTEMNCVPVESDGVGVVVVVEGVERGLGVGGPGRKGGTRHNQQVGA
jgi:hypothetical protein